MPLITDTETLHTLCEALKTEEFVTVDTEFLREKTYYPQLCLIQVASSHDAFAIDPLAPGMDLSPLLELMANSNVLKVFHSARQDIEILLKLSGQVPAPLFDTQVAAMVCGFGEAASYETLVTKLAGRSIDKSCRFTDWSQRPLTEQQYHYALSDVTHLRTVYAALKTLLTKTNRTSWLKEEMDFLTNPDTYRILPEDAWKKIKIKSSSPRFIRLVQALAALREQLAKERNIPRNHLLKEQLLLEVAASAPMSVEELARIRSLGAVAADRQLAEGIVGAIRSVKNGDSILPPLEELKAPLVVSAPLVELLRLLLKTVAYNHQVAEKLISTSAELVQMASAQEPAALMQLPVMQGWRFELFGRLALELRAGKIALSAQEDKMCIVKLSQSQELVG